jgi:hypothetical protein
MNPVLFSLTYLVSWLLMGLGVFLTFRLVATVRRGTTAQEAKQMTLVAGRLMVVGLVTLVVMASMGAFYAGAYTFYNLMLVP